MDFNSKSIEDLILSLEGEMAKGLNEIRHAQADLEKAENRHKFVLALTHYIKEKYKDIQL